jgi:ATP-dependent phosphofructokinase / diphosphate-dependent phosphofructokinase
MAKRIGVLTSGGDCAGLNAAIRAVTLSAQTRGFEVVGVRNGYTGLLDPATMTCPLTPPDVGFDMLIQGGTMLGTYNKYYPHNFLLADGTRADRTAEVVAGIHALKLDGLVGIGGDGSMAMFARLCAAGDIPFIGVPKTMDKDIGLTETTIGFDTAVHVATTAMEQLQPTAKSHGRVMILEVMGRDAGHVALHTGLASGADAILIPEISYDFNNLSKHIRDAMQANKYALVIVSESIASVDGKKTMIQHSNGDARYGGIAHTLAHALSEQAGLEVRATVLGHVQRGAPPTPGDRLLAARLGTHAVDLISQGAFNQMVGIKNGDITAFAIADVAKTPGVVDVNGMLVHTARQLGIYTGVSTKS